MCGKGKWLVLLDVDGTLCTRLVKKNRRLLSPPGISHDYHRGKVYSWRRPHAVDFVRKLYEEEFDVGIWTSALEYNGKPLVDHILGEELVSRLSVKAFRDKCQPDPEGENSWDTKKVISMLLEEYPEYDESSTILVDDSERKTRDNIQQLCITPASYEPCNLGIDYLNDSTLLDLIDEILAVRMGDYEQSENLKQKREEKYQRLKEKRSDIKDWRSIFTNANKDLTTKA